MSGYTTVAADSIEAAVSIAKGCPFLDVGGKLEVSELMAMPGGRESAQQGSAQPASRP